MQIRYSFQGRDISAPTLRHKHVADHSHPIVPLLSGASCRSRAISSAEKKYMYRDKYALIRFRPKIDSALRWPHSISPTAIFASPLR